ncbi:MAG: hypothetical protein WA634_16555 [Silvibacterium sp.]
MRRQNPPQSCIDYAQELDKYLSPLPLAAIYCLSGFAYCILISLIFAGLVYVSVLNPTPVVITIFAAVGFIPTTLLFFAWFLRPNDPISSHLTSLANMWRTPISAPADPCTFKIWLRSGESLCIQLTFYYPSSYQASFVKERLYTHVQATLANNFSARVIAPTPQEIERAIDPQLEVLASKCNIPVLYMEIQDVYTDSQDNAAPMEYLRTGT